MLKLIPIDFKEFKNDIYPYYVELFPKDERKNLKQIEIPNQKGITKLVKIMDDNNIVGFLIYNIVDNNKYVLLDYFAIFKEFQNKKYGTQAVEMFKDFFKDYKGIYGEVEKLGLGKDDKENNIREKRIKFWKSLGFQFLDIDLELFKVIYTPCILKIQDIKLDNDDIIKSAFEIYYALLGEERVNKNCKIIKDSY